MGKIITKRVVLHCRGTSVNWRFSKSMKWAKELSQEDWSEASR